MRTASVISFLASLAVLGCSNGDGGHSSGGSSGASGGGGGGGGSSGGSGPANLEVQPLYYRPPDQPVDLLENGEMLELWHAPQGGHVVVIGARVRGLDTDFIEIRGRIRNPDTRVIVAEESRTVVMEEVAGEPGWKQTDRRTCSQASHIPLCPDYGDRDIVGQPYLLEVFVTELYADFSTGSAELTLVPGCLQTDPAARDFCNCECAANYTLGKCSIARDGSVDPFPNESCPN